MRTLPRLARLGAAAALGITTLVVPSVAHAGEPSGQGASTTVIEIDAGPGDVVNLGEFVPLTECDQTVTANIGTIFDRKATAFWRVHCNVSPGNRTRVVGWVEDRKSDGLCARVKADIAGVWYYSPRACPKGNVQNFTLTGNSDHDPQVFLYLEA